MPTLTHSQQLSTKRLSALYDRIYDIADRLFKKYNPCEICIKDNKTKCINKHYNCNHLCCQWWTDRCKHWDNGCTVKCLACKLFACYTIEESKRQVNFIKTLYKLRRIANKHGLSNFDYYMTKKEALQMRSKVW